MMIKKILISSTALLVLMFGGVAQAKPAQVAKVLSLKGQAVVERSGQQYLAQSGMVLKEGDIVRSLKGLVKVRYQNCTSTVEAKKELTVTESAPCAVAKFASASSLQASKVALATAIVPGVSVGLVQSLVGAAGVGVVAVGRGGSSSSKAVSP